jgi:polar amino acid transport system permease protein
LALGIGYGAFEAEVFRAGIQSISKGQMEAAKSLGMTYFQAGLLLTSWRISATTLQPFINIAAEIYRIYHAYKKC